MEAKQAFQALTEGRAGGSSRQARFLDQTCIHLTLRGNQSKIRMHPT